MGASTIGKINRKITIEELEVVISKIYGEEARVIEDSRWDAYYIEMLYNEEVRSVVVWNGDDETTFSLNTWGDSEGIIRSILEYFGGDLIPNDCLDSPSKFIFKTQALSEEEKANITLLTELHKIFPLNNELVKRLIDNKNEVINILTNIK